jgi:hypothetical protein
MEAKFRVGLKPPTYSESFAFSGVFYYRKTVVPPSSPYDWFCNTIK